MLRQCQSLFIRSRVFVSIVFFGVSVSMAHAEPYKNFLDIEFTTVPAGKFKMGSPASSDVAYTNEFPQHEVLMPAFPMSKNEVTLGQFKKYIIDTDLLDIVTDGFMAANSHGDNAPVVYVSWNDVKGFVNWMNDNKPQDDPGTYRLPAEAEWEYACRAGANKRYCGGSTPSTVAWHSAISGSHQQDVGRKTANGFGLHDMSGNANEWVEDCYHETFEGAPGDGSAWVSDCKTNAHVLRGGSWRDSFRKVRVAIRKNAPSVDRKNTMGFRLVRQL